MIEDSEEVNDPIVAFKEEMALATGLSMSGKTSNLYTDAKSHLEDHDLNVTWQAGATLSSHCLYCPFHDLLFTNTLVPKGGNFGCLIPSPVSLNPRYEVSHGERPSCGWHLRGYQQDSGCSFRATHASFCPSILAEVVDSGGGANDVPLQAKLLGGRVAKFRTTV